MDPIRVAVVGCGRISDLHELAYCGRDDARIVAVCDTKRRHACEKARAWGIDKVYAEYDQLLADPEVDLVELLVPHHLHAEMTVAACQAGKHVSVQKPMALAVGEADRMIEAAEQARVVLRVYENFRFYPPHVRAKEMIDAGEIGEPQMIRLHVGTGKSETGWKVPLSAWLWRFNEGKCGGGPLVFDHGYHLFSLARYLDFSHTPNMVMDSIYYSDDDRVEIIGDRGILFVNRCTARTVDLPPLMLFRDGKTDPIPVERFEWHDSFIDCTRHLIDVLRDGGQPVLDGPTGKAVLQFALAAHISAREGREVRPDEVR
jgi:predicted dehydrogenase